VTFGYTDPYEAAREVQQQVQPWAPYPPGFPGVPEGPLADVQNQVGQVLASAAPRGLRHEPMAESLAKGAALGAGSALLWQAMRRRKTSAGQFTTPVVRAAILWLVLLVLTCGAYAGTDSLWVLFGGFALSWIVAISYARHANRKLRRGAHRAR
jgi:hypothetical protein